MSKEKKKVLIFTTSMGHYSLAQAAQEAFEAAGWTTKLHFSEFTETNLTYKPIYLFFPTFQKSWIEFSKNEHILRILNHLMANSKKKEIEKAIKRFRPDTVFSTYFLYNNQIALLKNKYGFTFLNLLANTRNLHPLEFIGDRGIDLSYDKSAINIAKKYKIPSRAIIPVGWLTRKDFYQSYKAANTSKKEFTVLLCGGSWGANKMVEFLPPFLKLKGKIRLILVAGSGKLLYQIFSLFKKTVDNGVFSAKGSLDIEIFQFTNEMPRLMAESDLIVGKAGPNLLFESIAAGKPFIAISHISGTEDGSLKLIKEKNLGWVAEKPREFTKVLTKIIKDKSFLEKIIIGVEKERSQNIKTSQRIIKVAEES